MTGHSAYQAEMLAMRMIAYSSTIIPDTTDHLAVLADRDVVDTVLTFAIKARRWIEGDSGMKEVKIVETEESHSLSYPAETNFLRALHGIVHSTWLFSDWIEASHTLFSQAPAKRIIGIMFETDRFPRKSAGLENLALTYLSLRHPEQLKHSLMASN